MMHFQTALRSSCNRYGLFPSECKAEMYIPALDNALSVLFSLFGLHPYQSDSSQVGPVFSLDEGTVVKIFGFLPMRDLLRVSRVCKLWNRLSYDRLLWKVVDLRHFSKALVSPIKFQALAVTRLAGKVNCLELSGFTLTEETLGVLATHCKELRVFKLKSVTFATRSSGDLKESRCQNTVLFPRNLEYLDIRFSHGNPRVYRAIAEQLSNVKWLGLCDPFFRAVLTNGELGKTIDSMKHLQKLDLSHCLLLEDSTLLQFARCSNLKVLSVRRCSFLTGSFIECFLESCAGLKTLILDGISLDDETLQKIPWRYSSLKHVELGWCPLVTPVGLKSALPRIARIQTLEYLGLCAIGAEKAFNDELLLDLGASLTFWRCKKLKHLNVSRSRSLTQDGVDEFNKMCTSVEMLDTTDCPAIKTRHSTQSSETFDNFQDDRVFKEKNNSTITQRAEVLRQRKGSISATQFARSKYTLETPL